jgi:hypothetical protein
MLTSLTYRIQLNGGIPFGMRPRLGDLELRGTVPYSLGLREHISLIVSQVGHNGCHSPSAAKIVNDWLLKLRVSYMGVISNFGTG